MVAYSAHYFKIIFKCQVLDLQLELMNLTAQYEGEEVTLNDICFQPLYPDNKDCAVMSALQYWQLNATNLEKCMSNMENKNCTKYPRAEDWHDQLIGCAK